jgi:hypothetical protein
VTDGCRKEERDDEMRSSLTPANGQTTHDYAARARVLPIQSHKFVPIRAMTEEAEE